MIQLGIVGHPIGHSKSPRMHEAALAVAGMNGQYIPHDVTPDALLAWLQAQRDAGMRGFNVTVPHKVMMAQYCDRLDESAAAVGAVNTVLIHGDGTVVGFNTDVSGFASDLVDTAQFDPNDSVALVLGTGGAAAAVVVALRQAGASTIVVTNRTAEKARIFAERMDVQSMPFDSESLRSIQPDLVVNATSCGLAVGPEDEQWDSCLHFFENLPVDAWNQPIAYDLIYAPKKTAFLTHCSRAGCATFHGLGMLVRQGALAFQLWTGVPVSRVKGPMGEAISPQSR